MDIDRRSQHRSRDDDETAVLVHMNPDEEALTYSAQGPSGSSGYQGPFLDAADMDICRELEVHRSSAEYYLNQYLENASHTCLDLDTLDTSQDLVNTTKDQDRRMARMKISRDSAVRDLLAMETILAHAKNTSRRSESSMSRTAAAMCTAACTLSAYISPVRFIAGASIAGAVTGVVYLTVPPAWHLVQQRNIDDARSKAQQLRCSIEAGTVDDRGRDILKPSQFSFLKWSFGQR